MPSDLRERVLDAQRLRALRETALLDGPPEEGFDRLTLLSSELLRVPVALVTLVDEHRLFFKSALGLREPWASRREAPLSHSFCQHVVASGQPLALTDARESPQLSHQLALTELGVIAYAGVPLEADGQTIGCFCVIDRKPRAWADHELRLLRELARAVEVQIAALTATRALAARERLLATVLRTMPAGVVLRDPEGAVVRTNPALERLLGYSEGELITTDFWSITHPEDLPGDAQSRDELLAGDDRVVTRIKRFRHAQGHYIWARLSAAVLRDEHGQGRGTVAVVEDVTAEHQAEEAIVQQARIYHTIARNIPGGAVLLFDTDLRFIAADGAELLASIGLGRDELEGRSVAEIARPEQRAELERVYREALAGNSAEYEAVRQGRRLKTRVAPVWNDESISGGIALIQDVTEEHAQAEAVRRAKALFEVTIANVRDGVVVLDAEHRVLYANRAYAELLDFDPATLLGTTRADFLAHVAPRVAERQAFVEHIERPAHEPSGASAEFLLVSPRLRHVRRSIAPLELPDGPGYMVVWQDISAEKRLLAEQEREALTDVLTGIPNRRAAERELAKALALAQRGSAPLSVALFDVDHFKRVNDQYGHDVGDEVLRRVATTIDRAKRLTDTVARWGGEEFLAVLPVPLDGAVNFCERVRREIELLACPGAGHVTVSAGVAEVSASEGAELLLKRADESLYAAKANGRNRVVANPPA
jgi:diguanylate cyclase (GGDEF)-like protein/PAS domain S-box-containing protein